MLRDQCARCNAPLEELWQMCPYCATPVVPQQLNLDVAPAAEAKIALVDDTIPLVPQAERRRRRRLSNRERAGLPRALGISAPDRD
jgi:hypothetical protein